MGVVIHIDGASRGNPGPAGIGVHIKLPQSTLEFSVYLGKTTNNVAEYIGLIFALWWLSKTQIKTGITIYSDSLLLVKQIQGFYKVKTPHIKRLFGYACHFGRTLSYRIVHTLREGNTQADALANKAIDEKVVPPAEFASLLVELMTEEQNAGI